jgi:hypothetical protein
MFEVRQPKIDDVPQKALVQGPVMHMDMPPPPEFDIADPEVRAKIERGEDLGKGDQEDGLPGSVHGSIGLLYAGLVGVEKFDNVKLYPELLEIEDFLECFLKYSTRLVSLDLSGAEEAMTEEFLTFIPYCGASLRILDLERCNLEGDQIETLVETCKALTGLQHLDVANNKLGAADATFLLASLAENRIDLQSIRLDGNPVGDIHEFRQDVAGLLAARGDQVVAGGELVLHLDVDAVRWFPEPRADTLAARRRDDTLMMAATSLDELSQAANDRNNQLDELFRQGSDPRTKSIKGREMLQEKRDLNNMVLSDKMLNMYQDKVLQGTVVETLTD